MEVSHLKLTMVAPEEVSVDTVVASVISELERISSLKEEQRTTLKAFINGKDVFALLLASFCKSFFSKMTQLVVT